MPPESDDDPELYRRLMAIKPAAFTANRWLTAAGVNRSFFGDLRKRGRARHDSIEKLIVAAGLTPAEFFAAESHGKVGQASGPARETRLPFRIQGEARDIPLLGTALGGTFDVGEAGEPVVVELIDVELDNVIDYVRRPASLVGRADVYCVTMVGDSMAPWARDGDPAYINPRQQPSIEDHVLVQVMKRDATGDARVVSALIKKLLRRTTAYVELEQYNPPLRFRVPVKDIARIHRVVPWRDIIIF